MTYTRRRAPVHRLLTVAVAALLPAAAAAAAGTPLTWITLGTKGGPLPLAERSQPANALIVADHPWLVDCGDGAMERLAAAGYKPGDVDRVFLSHLHIDHIGGLQGLIGIRWMSGSQAPLTIYGPPGTQELVDGLIRSLAPSLAVARHEPMHGLDPARMVRVVTVRDGGTLDVDGVKITAVRNSHFDDPQGRAYDNGTQSLSYRFDDDGYAITYTGDTGPSDAVARLARGSQLLVSEVVDLRQATAAYAQRKDLSEGGRSAMLQHLSRQHLTPQEAGRIATEAGVPRLVFTHLSIYGTTASEAPRLVAQARETYAGKIEVAHDLDRF